MPISSIEGPSGTSRKYTERWGFTSEQHATHEAHATHATHAIYAAHHRMPHHGCSWRPFKGRPGKQEQVVGISAPQHSVVELEDDEIQYINWQYLISACFQPSILHW